MVVLHPQLVAENLEDYWSKTWLEVVGHGVMAGAGAALQFFLGDH